MGIFNRRKKNQPESFEQLARKASEHEDCFILAAFPKVPGLPDESIIDEYELGDVISRAVEDYLAEVQNHADFMEAAEAAAEEYEERRARGEFAGI